MIRFLGYLNLALLVSLLCPFLLRRINKYSFNYKNMFLRKAAAGFVKVHPFLGLSLLVSALLHGYIALGAIRLHTGTVLWTGILIQVMLGIAVKKTKKPILLKVHRVVGLLPVILVLAHLYI
jgi:hypothetical protein